MNTDLLAALEAFPEEPNPYTYRLAYKKARAAIAAAVRQDDSIFELREALVIARAWMPDRPLTMSAWSDVARVNAALDWAPPPKPEVEKQ